MEVKVKEIKEKLIQKGMVKIINDVHRGEWVPPNPIFEIIKISKIALAKVERRGGSIQDVTIIDEGVIFYTSIPGEYLIWELPYLVGFGHFFWERR